MDVQPSRGIPESSEAILAALDPDQRAVAEALAGPVCVLAGAGTGKTRAITHRIAYGVRTGQYSPSSVLAVTFTARAAGEMRTRLRALGADGVQARTFHSAALRQLQYFWPDAIGGRMPRILEHKASAVAEAAGRLRLSADRVAIRDLAAEVEWAKVSLVSPDDYVRASADSDRDPVAGFDRHAVARVLSEYEEVKNERGVIDFEDVLLLTVGILVDRPEIAETVRQQYRHFVVDEYQDVSPVQQRLLDLWLGDRTELCVVGDANQTIYSFTGATPAYLLDFTKRYPDATVVRLVRDYRSTPQVVQLANTLRRRARGSAGRGGVDLVAQQPTGPAVSFAVHSDDVAEASAVAQRIGRLIASGMPAREMAVLYRTNAQSEAVEQALADAGIGYQVRGGERFFARPEVRDAVALIRGAARADASDEPMPDSVRDVLSTIGWARQPPAGRGAAREKWESLNALVTLAEDVAASRPEATLPDFAAELAERAAAQHAPAVAGVTLASLHAAKGLEWDAVFLIGVSDGLLPISMAESEDAIEEERRLLYVGVTRARSHLTVSFARSRNPGSAPSRRPSRFLDGYWPETRNRRKRAAQETELDASGQALMSELQRWRTTTAKTAAIPAYAVLHDSTLRALASHRPTSIAELAQIPGIGPVKIDRYAGEILDIVREAQ